MPASVFLGRGDVLGPSLATDGAIAVFDGTTGKLIKVGAGGGGYVSSITGTANQITASASTGAVTLSIPSTLIAPGSIAATTTVSGTTGTFSTSTVTPLLRGAGATTQTMSSDGIVTWQNNGGTRGTQLDMTVAQTAWFLSPAGADNQTLRAITVRANTFNANGTDGVTAGPFTTITGIRVVGGLVTVLTGS